MNNGIAYWILMKFLQNSNEIRNRQHACEKSHVQKSIALK